jgi:hypothetical protein
MTVVVIREDCRTTWAAAGELEERLSEADRKDGRQVVPARRVGKNILEVDLWRTVPPDWRQFSLILRDARIKFD